MNPQNLKARNLYFQTDMTQAEIAAIVGVSDQTVYRWIKQNNWKQMKEAAMQTPLAIVEMLYKQLYALNKGICTREEPVPTLQEAEINRKLINSIDKLKRQASLSENIQVLMGFTGFLTKIDTELAKTVVLHADHYLKEKLGNAPFGFYEEPEEEQKTEEEQAVEPFSNQSVPQTTVIKEETKLTTEKNQPAPGIAYAQAQTSQPQQTPEPPTQPQSLSTTDNTPKQKSPCKIGRITYINQRHLSPEQQKIKNNLFIESRKSKKYW